MRIGAHVRQDDDPIGQGEHLGADLVQVFLSDPQKWTKPGEHPRTEEILASDVDVVVHSPYVINVASLNNRVRMPSRKAVADHAEAAARIGALGLVVHGGHVRAGEDVAAGVENWRKLFERQEDKGGFGVPILVENTAGGDFAMARYIDAIGRLWDAIGDYGPGFCLDTCHAWAAGEDLVGVVERQTVEPGGNRHRPLDVCQHGRRFRRPSADYLDAVVVRHADLGLPLSASSGAQERTGIHQV